MLVLKISPYDFLLSILNKTQHPCFRERSTLPRLHQPESFTPETLWLSQAFSSVRRCYPKKLDILPNKKNTMLKSLALKQEQAIYQERDWKSSPIQQLTKCWHCVNILLLR